MLFRSHVQRILCPVDFSDSSQHALLYAHGLGQHFGARVFVQHTVQPGVAYLGGMDPGPAVVDSEVQIRAAREEVRKMLSAADNDSAEVTVLLNSGDLAARILETESKERIDLLVMGSPYACSSRCSPGCGVQRTATPPSGPRRRTGTR